MLEASLFELSTSPPTSTLIDSVVSLMFIKVAASICVLAVAIVGLTLLSGRLQIRRGFRVVVGCLVFLGAPTLAAGLFWLASSHHEVAVAQASRSATPPDPRQDLQPSGKAILIADKLPNPGLIDLDPYFRRREMAGRYTENKAHSQIGKVEARGFFGTKWIKEVVRPAAAEFAQFPQYAGRPGVFLNR